MKRALIVVSLIDECGDIANCDIEEEIKTELSSWIYIIPWGRKVESVTVK